MPSWEALAQGARPNRPNPEEEIVVRELDLHPGQNRLSGGGRFGASTGPTGSRHHCGLGTPRRRDRLSEGSISGWRSPQKSQGTEGENLSRTRWRGRTRQIGGRCCRSGWTLVKRSFPVRAFFGVGQSAECSGVHPNPSGTQQRSRSRTRCWSTRRQPLPVAQHPQEADVMRDCAHEW